MIIVRADANEIIGTGHIMRCLSIADSFKNNGETVVFVSADSKGRELVSSHGFEFLSLDSNWADMESELSSLKTIIDLYGSSLLLIDSYYVTERYFEELSKKTRLVYIDDLNNNRWSVDFLVNYNIFSSALDYSSYKNSYTRLMLQTNYVPLRNEFKNAPKHLIKNVTDILVSAGGADPEKITEKIINSICPLFPQITFHFVVGALNPRLDFIKFRTSASNNISLHVNERNMSKLMQACDVAISAAGSTLYELCAMGLPTITYALADNQILATNAFSEAGLMLNAGDCRNNNSFMSELTKLLQRLIDHYDMRASFSSNMQELVDGSGSDRIVSYIHKSLLKDASEILCDRRTVFTSIDDAKGVARGTTELGRMIKVEFEKCGSQKKILNSTVEYDC